MPSGLWKKCGTFYFSVENCFLMCKGLVRVAFF
jgi:hypothetical protein